jgi:hypothetical protein
LIKDTTGNRLRMEREEEEERKNKGEEVKAE